MKSTESELQISSQFRRVRQLQMMCVGCVAAALAAYYLNKWLAVALLCPAVIMRLFFRKQKKLYRREFLHVSAERTLRRHMEQSVHLFDAPHTEQELRQVRMLPCDAAKSGLVCCEGGTGRYHGRNVRLTGVTFAHTYTPERAKRVNYTVGTWVSVQLNKDTGMDCRFLSPRTAPMPSLKEMLWVETDLKLMDPPADMSGSWYLVCREGCESIPGAGFLKQLDRVYSKTDGLIAVCVQGDRLHFLLEDEVLAQEVSIRTPPEQSLERRDLLPGLSHGLRLADFLQD